jgi:hypothetical protein
MTGSITVQKPLFGSTSTCQTLTWGRGAGPSLQGHVPEFTVTVYWLLAGEADCCGKINVVQG